MDQYLIFRKGNQLMIIKKSKVALLVLLCLAALLAACGKGETAEPSVPVAAETSALPEQPDEVSSPEASPYAPIEYETADGFMRSFLLASQRDLIGTTNDLGEFYRVIYAASLEGNELTVCGSMDYRNFKDQDTIYITDDLTHIFKVDDSTVYRKGTETGNVTIQKEEFAELLESRKNSGMFLEVEVGGGVVKSAYLAAQ